MPTEIRFANNITRHDNHVPPVSLTQRIFLDENGNRAPINSLLLYNTSSTVTISLSFDGTNSLSIKPGGALAMDFAKLYSYWTSGDGSAALQVVTGSET